MAAMAEDRTRPRFARDFDEAVNMTARELTEWLQTNESRASGSRARTASLRKRRPCQRPADRRHPWQKGGGAGTDDDYAHMRKVVGYVRRHRAQEPANIVTSRWRYSLMNWGHDPTKE